MRVYTYYDQVPGINIEEEKQLIRLWEISWKKHGWTPIVLSIQTAMKHPEFHAYHNHIKSLPSICPPGYDAACFLRWIAMEWAMMTAGDAERSTVSECNGVDTKGVDTFGVLSTYACMNYGFTPNCLQKILLSKSPPDTITKTLFLFDGVPCVMCGSISSYSAIRRFILATRASPQVIQWVQRHLLRGSPHARRSFLNDMIVLRLPGSEMLQSTASVGRLSGKPGFMKAPLVHFTRSHAVESKYKSKVHAIQCLRPISSPSVPRVVAVSSVPPSVPRVVAVSSVPPSVPRVVAVSSVPPLVPRVVVVRKTKQRQLFQMRPRVMRRRLTRLRARHIKRRR